MGALFVRQPRRGSSGAGTGGGVSRAHSAARGFAALGDRPANKRSSRSGATAEIPWDFARHYCDPSYRPRVETVAAAGRQSIGSRIRSLREAARMTQEELSSRAGIGRVTLVRIEKGEQSPRYETLVALSRALGIPLAELLLAESAP